MDLNELNNDLRPLSRSNSRKIASECVDKIYALTGYPSKVIRNILEAERLVLMEDLVDKLSDTKLNNDTKIRLGIPYYGDIYLSKSKPYNFYPYGQFSDLLNRAINKRDTPLLSLLKVNFEDSMSYKYGNLVRDVNKDDE